MKKSIQTILTFRKKHTLKQTGEKFGITAERVRQIEQEQHRKYCKKHTRYYFEHCSHCSIDTYKKLFDFARKDFLLNEANRQAKNRKRDYESVKQRQYIVQNLRNRFKMSFSEIARLLKRDVSTIKHSHARN